MTGGQATFRPCVISRRIKEWTKHVFSIVINGRPSRLQMEQQFAAITRSLQSGTYETDALIKAIDDRDYRDVPF
jgi:hypothetical protein